MKKILISLFALLPFVCFSQVKSLWLESQNVISKDKFLPVLKAQGTYIPKGAIGFTAFTLVNPTWAEAIIEIDVQPTFKKLDAFEFSTGFGIEHAPTPIRMAATLFLQKSFKKSSFTTLNVFEYGGSGYWYLSNGVFQIIPSLRAGWHIERYVGVGPRIEFYEKPFTFFICGVYDPEIKMWKGNFGVNAYFGF